jgi:putative spermidine/putrescine transport system permease protein
MGRYVDDILTGLVYAVFALAFLFLLVPLVITITMAFDSRPYLGPLPPPSFSLQWFERLMSDAYLLRGLVTSVQVSVLAVFVSTIVGVVTAIVLDRSTLPARDLLIAIFVSPLVVPAVVVGFALLLFLANLGIFDGFTRLVCGHVILTVPYTIRATAAGLAGIDSSLPEAASSLGANDTQAFWTVTFPLARTGIIAGAILAFAVSLDDVAVSMFLTDATTYTLPVALISNMRASFDLTLAAASILLIGFTIILILILDRFAGVDRVVGIGLQRS